MSTLFFHGDRVYKLKKPVDNGFLDFTEVASRREACHREVELNRRFAPDVYLGVADISMGGDELDHVVVMRRLAEGRRLSALLDDPSTVDELRRLAHLVGTIHGAAPRGPEIDALSGHAALRRLWDEGIEQISQYAGSVLEAADVDRLDRLSHEYLAGRGALFDSRVADGHACDGHGDLQAEDIFCLEDGPRILDCLEFDDRLRYGDVLNDVAFLAMDLERLGHRDLAQEFLERYREFVGGSWPSSLEHHYMAYRAHVRAKVACIRHTQGDPEARALARSFHALALAHLEAGRIDITLVGGTPGTGKSSVARELADRLDAVVVSSDDVRDELQPRRSSDSDVALHEERYAPELVDAVYDEMLRRARLMVTMGERVVLDASWLDPQRRERAHQLAASSSTPLIELRCDCSAELAEARIVRRQVQGGDSSEATVSIARLMAAEATPWTSAHVIDTGLTLDGAVSLAEAIVTRR